MSLFQYNRFFSCCTLFSNNNGFHLLRTYYVSDTELLVYTCVSHNPCERKTIIIPPLYTRKLRQRWAINLGCLTCNSASLPSSGGEDSVVLYQKVYKVPFCIYSFNKHVLRVYCLPSHAWALGK